MVHLPSFTGRRKTGIGMMGQWMAGDDHELQIYLFALQWSIDSQGRRNAW